MKEFFIANKYRSVALALAVFAVAGTAPAFAQSSGTWSAGIGPGLVSPSASSVTATQRTIDGWRPVMFDYRNLNSDYRRPLPPDPGDAWVWIAGTILLLLVLAVAFVSYEPIQPPCRPSCSMSQPG